jgi:CRP-like cAMP-binding protein
MTELQKNEFTARMIEKEYKKGDIIWGRGVLPDMCLMLLKGEMIMIGSYEAGTIKINPGNFAGDFPYLLNNKACNTAIRAITDCVALELNKGDFVDLLRANPGLLIYFNDKFIIE